MLSFQNVALLVVSVMVLPFILGFMSSVSKKLETFLTIVAGLMAVAPLAPVVYYLAGKFFLHPELYGSTNWNAYLILILQFVALSLAIIDAFALGHDFSKEPVKTIGFVIVCIAICTGFFFGLDYFNENTNQIHFMVKDVMHLPC